MTNEQFETLERYEENMETAVVANYSRNISKKNRKGLKEIFNALFPKERITNINCSGCLVDVLKKLAEAFKKEKAKRARKGNGEPKPEVPVHDAPEHEEDV